MSRDEQSNLISVQSGPSLIPKLLLVIEFVNIYLILDSATGVITRGRGKGEQIPLVNFNLLFDIHRVTDKI